MWKRHYEVYRCLEPRLFKVIDKSIFIKLLGLFKNENSAWERVIQLVYYLVDVFLRVFPYVSGWSFMTSYLHIDLHVIKEIVVLGIVQVVVSILKSDSEQQNLHCLEKVYLDLLQIIVQLQIQFISSQSIWEENCCINTQMNNYGQNKMHLFIHWRVTLNNDGSILRFQRIKPHDPIFDVGQNQN